MSYFGGLARNWIPPAMHGWVQHLRGGGIRFEGEFPTWEAACAHCTGYGAEDILTKALAAIVKVKQGAAAFERDSVLFEKIEYDWPVVAGLMMVAARNAGTLNVLDFGGALGSSYFQNLQLLNTLPRVKWNIVEQPHFVKAGKANVQDDKLRFYSSIQECLTENKPNVVLLSSVLQYLSEPASIFLSLLNVGADSVILDRTSINFSASDRIYVQHVPSSIYLASYACRSFSESGLLTMARGKYQLSAAFPSLSFPALERIGSQLKGYIFSQEAMA
jgi:putative methyltransferase (TIGR04325 family)